MPSQDRESVSVRTADGWVLRGDLRRRENSPAVVVCGHAMMVDRRTLDRPPGRGLASVLHARGLEIVTMDARGHGESGPGAAEGARWSYDDIIRFDVPAMVRLGRELAGARSVVLLGHSLIGHAGLIAAGLSDPPDALVGYAPNPWAPSLEPSRLARCIKRGTLESWAALTKLTGYFDTRALRLGTDAEAEPYVSHFLSMWRADTLASPDGALRYEACLSRARLPVLAYSSRGDRLIARPAAVGRFLALAENASIEHRIIDGPDAPGHMGFTTDLRSEKIWQSTATWIHAL